MCFKNLFKRRKAIVRDTPMTTENRYKQGRIILVKDITDPDHPCIRVGRIKRFGSENDNYNIEVYFPSIDQVRIVEWRNNDWWLT